MQKTTLIFLFFLLNLSFLRANNRDVVNNASFNVSFSLTGEVFVEFYSYNPATTFKWELEYGPAGFQTGQGTTRSVNGTGIMTFKLNPFIKYDFRIRSNEWVGTQLVWTDWSETLTVSTSNTYNFVGYTNDFNNRNESQSDWKGVIYNNSDAQSYFYMPENDSHGGASGSSVKITNSYKGSIAFVSPKFNDLTIDLKISFWVRDLYAGSELLVGTMSDPNNMATFHLLSEVAVVNPVNNWEQKTVYFNNYKGGDQYVVFLFKSKSSDNNYVYISLDDISCEKSINCFDQTNLAVSNISEKSAQFNFNAPDQNNFEVSLKDLTSGLSEVYKTSSSPFVLNNLSGATEYEVKVRANCIDDLYSNWTSVKFKTICETITDNYSTSFEGPNYIDPCWSTITNISSIYKNSDSSQLPGQLTPKTGKRVIIMNGSLDGKNVAQKSYLISPYIGNIDTTERIRFNLIAYGTDNYNTNSLIVGTMSDPKDASTFVALKTISASEMNEIYGLNKLPFWKQHTIYFDNYKNGNNHHYIALKQNNLANSIFVIDDFIFEKAPLCNEPLNPRMLSFDYNFATIEWDSYKPATEWQVEYGPKGFLHGSGTIVNAMSSSIKLTESILDNTEYDFYIRTKCGSGYSDWSDKGYFKTKCSGVNAGFSENFENAVFDKEGCWTRITPKIIDRFWIPSSFISVKSKDISLPTVHNGQYSLNMFNELNADYTPESGSKSNEIILVTPRLKDFDNYKKITFWMLLLKEQNNGLAKEIVIGTLSNSADYKTFTSYRVLKIPVADIKGEWVKYEVDFSDYYGTDKFIGIKQNEVNGRIKIYIDDFEYTQNDCPKPTALTATQIGVDKVLLGWKDNNVKKQTEGWQIEYGPRGFAEGTETSVLAATNPFILTGLAANKNYDFRVKANCSVGLTSISSDSYSFKIVCTEQAPFTETFDQYDAKTIYNSLEELCWTTNKSGTEYLGRIVKYYLNNVNSSPNVFLLYNNTESGYLISPYFSDFDSRKKVKFRLIANYASGTKQVNVIVGTIKNPLDLSTFEPYESVSAVGLPQRGKEFEVDFSKYKGTNKQIAFKLESNENNNYTTNTVLLDNIIYGEKQSCPEPIDIAVTNINNNSADVKWIFKDLIQHNVQIEYGVTGFTQGTGTIVTVNKNEIAISGLERATSYDFYIKTICDNQNSIVVGPIKIETSCDIKPLPWIEKFNTVSSYGKNVLPDCFKLVLGDLTLRNIPQKLTGYEPDRLRTGYDDTSYIEINVSPSTEVVTPIFHLNSGTSYKFSLKARKGYEYSSFAVLVSVGRGQNTYNMECDLNKIGTLSEYNYNDLSYYFTPIVSGDYSFLIDFNGQASGANMLADNFEVKEGYKSSINGNLKKVYDFETTPDDLVLEGTSYSKIAVDTYYKWLSMSGNGTDGKWIDATNTSKKVAKTTAASSLIWEMNPNSITKVNMKVDATKASRLFMSFDLKMPYLKSNTESMFRVIVNGNMLGEVIQSTASTRYSFNKHIFDLTPYVGSEIRISLQHIGKSDLGDDAFIDNIIFAEATESLSIVENSFIDLKYYPNPIENVLNIESNSIISNLEIYDLNGKLLSKKKYSDSKIAVDFKSFSTGVYMIVLIKDDKKETFKVIKK
ncbi:T9SS-dependent choice-of-anchor J family protein [uncultured Flavobacterium sp.]|uniref:T9SS-dependent choice-of-anchor J family protein n=1 Tax=uncultured Flavobacterium sp. TaxID=165435 RepID=UPI002931C09E|nr:choice-of-anchor J domain-containing protein [uncultured Flavobacterium sp.]